MHFRHVARMDQNRDPLLSVFRAALEGPLGPTPLAYALRRGFDEIEALRQIGASWSQIVGAINACLVAAGRDEVSAATLRGMMGRLARNAVPGDNANPGNHTSSTHPSLPSSAVVHGPVVGQIPFQSMQGESKRGSTSMLDDAAELAATLQRIRDIK